MNKKLILLTMLVSSFGFSNKLPLNVNLHTNYSFNLNKISKKEMVDAGMQSLLPDGYTNFESINAIGVDVTTPIATPYFNVKVGVGAEFFVNYNLTKTLVEDDEFELLSRVSSDDVESSKASYNNVNYAYTVANNKAIVYEQESAKQTRRKRALEAQIAAHEEAKTKYNQDQVNEMKVKWEELGTKAQEAQTKEDLAAQKETKAEEKMKELEAQMDDAMAKGQWGAWMGYYHAYEDYKSQKEAAEQEGNEAHQEYVEALAERKKLFDIIDVADNPDEQIAKKTELKNQAEASIAESDEKKEYYTRKKRELRGERSSTREDIDLSEDEYKYLEQEFYDIIEEMYNADHPDSPLDPLPKLMRMPEEVEEPEEEEENGEDGGEISEAKAAYAKYEAEKAAAEEAKEKYEEKSEEIEARYRLLDEYYEELVDEASEEHNRRTLINHLDTSLKYGANIYGVVEIDKTFENDVKLLSSVKVGLQIKNNPLYTIAEDFQNRRVVIDGSEYVRPDSVKSVKVVPVVDFGIGVGYKGFRALLNTGYGRGFIGLDLGYEF